MQSSGWPSVSQTRPNCGCHAASCFFQLLQLQFAASHPASGKGFPGSETSAARSRTAFNQNRPAWLAKNAPCTQIPDCHPLSAFTTDPRGIGAAGSLAKTRAGCPILAHFARVGSDADCSADFDSPQISWHTQHRTRPCNKRARLSVNRHFTH